MKQIEEALTFDDVTLVPDEADFLPSDADLKTRFSRNVPLNIPIVSSPMDTVTEHQLAIAVAEAGGIGIIHRKNPPMTIERQVDEARRVKRHQSAIIFKPYTVWLEQSLDEAQNLMNAQNISGLPVLDDDGVLVGIITRKDLQFSAVVARVRDAMTRREKLVTANPGISPKEAAELMVKNRVEKLPLVDGKFHLAGLITAKDLRKPKLYPNANIDERGRLRVGAAVGVTGDFLERARELVIAGVDVIVIDSSHGHSHNVRNALLTLKKAPGMVDVVAGNIATGQAARFLADSGADGLRVGIGSGSICTTRVVTGCGVPQVSAIMSVYDETQETIPVCSDGGARFSGDIIKALAAGANSVMSGFIFAGTEETPGEKFPYQGQFYKRYRGMGSESVIKEGADRYGAKAVPEGVDGAVPYRGLAAEQINLVIGGLRQGMGYVGCRTVTGLRSKAVFKKLSRAGVIESHVHDILITHEAPNYQIRKRDE